MNAKKEESATNNIATNSNTPTTLFGINLSPKTITTIKQFVKFALIGVLNTGVDLFILNIATLISGITSGTGYAVQKGFSFLTAVCFSYFLNKYWAFQDKSHFHEGIKVAEFLLVSVIGMIINISVATIVVTYIKPLINISLFNDNIWVNIGALSGTSIGLMWNFIGYKLFVFHK